MDEETLSRTSAFKRCHCPSFSTTIRLHIAPSERLECDSLEAGGSRLERSGVSVVLVPTPAAPAGKWDVTCVITCVKGGLLGFLGLSGNRKINNLPVFNDTRDFRTGARRGSRLASRRLGL